MSHFLLLILSFDCQTATSTDVECVFSQGRILLSHVHYQLSSVNLSAHMSGELEQVGFGEGPGYICYHCTS